MRATRHAAFLAPLVLALYSTTALAATTISGSTTTPLKTSGAGDVTVASGGSIVVASAPAVTVDSANSVTVATGGTLTASASNNSGGVLVNSGETSTISNAGTISVLESYTAPVITGTSTAAGPIANTTGRYGIWVNGTGSGTITNTGTISVKGLGAAGILTSGLYNGSITNAGSITVIGDNSIGISTQAINGSLAVGGTVSVTGQGAQAVVVGGDITNGLLTLQGTIGQATSYTTDSATTQSLSSAQLSTGKALVEVDGNVAGGILVYAPCSATTVNNVSSCSSSNVTTTTGTLSSVGNSPAIQIGGASNITIGANAPSIGGGNYSLVVDGAVSGTSTFSGLNAYGIEIGGKGGNVTMGGGIGMTGTVTATSVDSVATGILINGGSYVPALTNSGTITATLTTAGASNSAAYAVRDLSGSLTQVTNNGTITASGGVTNAAVDLSANTTGVTYTQALNAYETQEQIQEQATSGYTYASRKIYVSTTGDIDTGSGNDTITISSGSVTGNAYLGGGNDAVALSNDADWIGNITFGAGTGSITMANTSTFTGALDAGSSPLSIVIGGTAAFAATSIANGSQTDVTVNGGSFGAGAATTMAVRSLTVNSGGEFRAYIDGTNGISSLVTATTATFASGSKVGATISSLNNAVGTYQILSAGTLSGNPTFDAADTNLPVLFKGSVAETGNSLYLTIARKTAADLGLTSAEAAGYNAIYNNALLNSSIATSLLQVADVPTLQAQMDTMLPDHSGGTFDFVSRADRLITQHLSNDASMFTISNLGVWLEPVYFRGGKETTGTAPFTDDGYGLSFGIERKLGDSRVGLMFAWIGGKVDDGSWEGIDANDYKIGAFWRMSKGPLYLFAKASADRVSFNSTRTFTGAVDNVALTYVADGHWSGWAYSGNAGASYSFPVTSRISLKPMVELDYIRLKENPYTETGASQIALAVDSRTSDSLDATTTLTASWSLGDKTPDDRPLTFELQGGRVNQISGSLGSTTAQFDGGNPFTITPDALPSGWVGQLRMLFGGLDYTWQITGRAEQMWGHTDFSGQVSLSLAL